MKYFLHDTSALDDEKVTMLYMEFGYEAVGLFYCILEKLGKQEKPVPEIVLRSQLNIKKRLQKQLDFMYKIGILSVKNSEVFSETLLNYSEKYQIKKEKTRKRVSDWRDKQKDTKNVTRYKPVSNASKVKLSKVKEIKEENNKKRVKIFFKDSEYYDIDKLKIDIDEKYHKYDLDHYHEAMFNWSEANGEKKVDWLAVCRTWINKADKKGEAVIKQDNSQTNMVF